MTRLHELTVVLYAFSVLLYFFDFFTITGRQTVLPSGYLRLYGFYKRFFTSYMIKTGRFPVLTIFEGLYFYAWVLVTLSLGINQLLKVDFIVFFTNILGFIVIAIHTFAPINMIHSIKASSLCLNCCSFISRWRFYLMGPFHCRLFFHFCI